mgnify:FL=1
MGSSMDRCSDGGVEDSDSQMDYCSEINFGNAIACKSPTDPSDHQSASKHMIVSNH